MKIMPYAIAALLALGSAQALADGGGVTSSPKDAVTQIARNDDDRDKDRGKSFEHRRDGTGAQDNPGLKKGGKDKDGDRKADKPRKKRDKDKDKDDDGDRRGKKPAKHDKGDR